MDKEGSDLSLRRMSAEEFVRRLKASAGQNDVHYAFWIGAGCSISAGIPGAASLVADRWLPKLQKIHGIDDADASDWAKERFPGYDPEDPGAMYGAVMEELFIQPEARQREVEALCDNRLPGFGYGVLAELLARRDGLFNVALTTNFDDLIADAMYVFTEARPLVIPDEALAAFIRPTRLRPLVIKVHGDHRLSPRNTQTETASLKQGISEGIANLLHDRGVIFVGYGGNDRDIAELLAALPARALPLGVWWVSGRQPEGALCDWLHRREAIWVESPGFEELMLLFHSEFEMSHPSSNKFDRLFAGYVETYRELERRVGRIADTDPQASSLKVAAARVDAVADDWWGILLQASRMENEDPQQAEELLKRGVREYPRAGVMQAEYGGFLMVQGRYEEALAAARAALEIEDKDVQALHLLAHALAATGDQKDSAETFEQVVELSPRAGPRAELGLALTRLDDYAGARAQLDKALSLQPSSFSDFGAVALLCAELGDPARAVDFHQRAVDASPENPMQRANFVRGLLAVGDDDRARLELKMASDLAPPRGPLRLEILFYQFVIGAPRSRPRFLAEIKAEVDRGTRAPNWSFAPVIAYGSNNAHPDQEWLSPLAKVINGDRGPDVLREWQKWGEAGDAASD